MIHTSLFGTLLDITYTASGSAEPVERFYASMFSSYYSKINIQPSCGIVHAIRSGRHTPPRKLLQYYRDPECPRCPTKLMEDLCALADCCFVEASRRVALRSALTLYLEVLPKADAENLLANVPTDHLIPFWTRLTWYALCGDRHE